MNNQFATQYLLEELDEEENSLEEMSSVGGGTTAGATFTPGNGEQVATTKAFKKRYEESDIDLTDTPEFKTGPTELEDYLEDEDFVDFIQSVFDRFTVDMEWARGHILYLFKKNKAELDRHWSDYQDYSSEEEQLNESRAYSRFKKETAIRPKDEQMHEAVKMIHKRLEEVSKLVEFAQQMRTELSEGDKALEYNRNTKKIFEKINSKVIEVYTKTRELK